MIQKNSTWKIFGLFAKNPTKQFHIREISRIINLAATSVRIHLEELEKNKLILKETTGLYHSFRANFDSEDFRFYKKILNLIELKESGLLSFLVDNAFPTSIVLFGSFMKGEDTEKSDIDLFLIAKEKEIDCTKYEKILGRKIQIFFSTDIKKIPVELKNNILNGVVVYGFLKAF